MQRALRRWHRRLGALIALLVLWLALSGIALNHAQPLGLTSTPVGAAWVARAYGLDPGVPETGFAAGPHWVVGLGGQLFLDDRAIADIESRVVGAVFVEGLIVTATRNRLWLLQADGTVVEQLRASTFAGPIIALRSTSANNVIVAAGSSRWAYEPLTGEVSGTDAPSGVTKPQALPTELAAQIHQRAMADAISWHKLIGDLHSGRAFTQLGVYAYDAAAVLLIFLSLSGLWMFFRRR